MVTIGRRGTLDCRAHGADLLAILPSHPLNCLVVDLHMPEVSGFDVLVTFDALNITTPVVVITGHDERGMAERVRALGASAYLRKPVDETALLSAIATATASPSSDCEASPT